MSMTTHDWANVELRRYPEKPRKSKKPADPMLYFSIVVILASISTLVMVFYLIKHAYDRVPDWHHVNSLLSSHER